MGGNVFKGKTRRYSPDEYRTIVNIIRSSFYSIYDQDIIIKDIPSYTTKGSYGDADLLLMKDDRLSNPDWRDLITKDLGITSIYKNGPVTSLLVSDFQVDIILSSSEDYDFSYNYFSYNDLGNLIGRLASNLGLKFGHNGLYYILRDDRINSFKEEVLVTKDYKVALDILGLEYSVETYIFNTIEDIFNYVISSRYFDSNAFCLESRSHDSRSRDKKRPIYMKFLDYLKDYPPEDKDRLFSKDYYLNTLLSSYPEFKDRYLTAKDKLKRIKILRSKFNGNLVRELTGLTGKDLGKFITKLKSSYDSYDNFILNSSDDKIKESILNFYHSKYQD